MTKECTLKEAYIIKALDELQPDWRQGADIHQKTKNEIRQRVANKYGDIFDPSEAACITSRSIENTVTRIREKLEIPSKMKDSIKKLDTPVRVGQMSPNTDEKPLSLHSEAKPEQIVSIDTKDKIKPSTEIPAAKEQPIKIPETPQIPEVKLPLSEFKPATELNPVIIDHKPAQPAPIIQEPAPEKKGEPHHFNASPLKDRLEICPCGCNYGYDPFDEKWYSPKEWA